MPPGSVVYMPKLNVHAFKNIGEGNARQIIATTPSGFETFFESCAEEFARPGGPDRERIVAIGVEHGIHFVDG
jgi:hypothetical protein